MPEMDRMARPPQERDAVQRSAGARFLRRLLPVVFALAVLAAAGLVSAYWLSHKPKARRRRPARQAAVVEVLPVRVGTHQVVVPAMGTVVPARRIELASRVAGKVVFVSPQFAPGGRFRKGETLLRIDPQDYEIAVRQQQAELQKRVAEIAQREAEIKQREAEIVRAQSELTIEMGRQAVAKREYELLGETVRPEDRDLVLRRPQLRACEAACALAKAARRSAEALRDAALAAKAAAEAALDKAKLDLERTTLRAPFDAVVLSRSVDLGSQIAVHQGLAVLAGTEEFWVEVSVPVDELRWIDIPGFNAESGARGRVFHEAAWGRDAFRVGTVLRLLSDLEPQGRMARVVVSVKDPLDTNREAGLRHPLLLGSFVRVQIEGRRLQDVVRIPRGALRDGKNVWIIREDSTLEIRPVRVAWAGTDYVLVRDGLRAGERLIVSDLAAPVPGMPLRAVQPASSERSE